MTRPRLLHLVPSLPSAAEGVSATAGVLARALAALDVADSEFLVAHRGDARGVEAGLAAAQPDRLLLHYVNYAYEAHGCPVALLDVVCRWASQNPGRLLTYFHEVYASGPPWTRTFWVAGSQRRLAADLASASVFCITSLPEYARRLRAVGYSGPVLVQAIPSTVGEPATVAPYRARPRRLVVFGSAGRRSAAYTETANSLARACDRLAIETIVDIGAGAASPHAFAGRPIERLGEIPAPEVSQRLLAAAAGFAAYPLDFLAKSSIFAAYTSHGLLPVVSGPRATAPSGPQPGRDYWDAGRAALSVGEEDAIAARGHAWYRQHDIETLANEIAAWLGAS